VLSSAFAILYYILDAHLFLQPQLVSQANHYPFVVHEACARCSTDSSASGHNDEVFMQMAGTNSVN